MKILMVSPYPPLRDGIGAYAVQTVAALRAEGHDVEVLSPGPSAAHHHLDLRGPRGPLALAKRVRAYDKVIVQFHPDLFYPVPTSTADKIAVAAALAAAFRMCREVEVVVHEVDYRYGRGPAGPATRAMWRQVDRVLVHSSQERDAFVRAFGVRGDRVQLVDHGAHFVPHTQATRAQARRSLGIAPDAHVLVAIGFVQPHKGFDRAVRAFAGLDVPGARLDVVGSVRVQEPAYVRYAEELAAMADQVPGAHVHLGYVSDELFDRWIVASDAVVLPYREIWSSSVMERALLLDRRVIATRVGALAEQSADAPGVTLVDDDAGLRAAVAAELGTPEDVVAADPWPSGADRDVVQREVLDRAARRRGFVEHSTTGSGRAPAAATAPLRRVGTLRLPEAGGGRGPRTFARRVVRKLTGWLLQPVVDQVNATQRATVEAIERAQRPAGDTAAAEQQQG